MFYNYDTSLTEIAENFSITRQSVRDCLIKCKELLANYEEKLNLLEKNKKISGCLNLLLDEYDIAKIRIKINNLKDEVL